MSDMDEGDTDYTGWFCHQCGLQAEDDEFRCCECSAPFPENLKKRIPYSGKPEPQWREKPPWKKPEPPVETGLRLAFVGGSLRGDIEMNTRILEALTVIAMEAGFLPMCFARSSLINLKLWENDPAELEKGQLLVDSIVVHVARMGGAFFVRQRDDGTFSEGTVRELKLFLNTHTSGRPEVKVYRFVPDRVEFLFFGSFTADEFREAQKQGLMAP